VITSLPDTRRRAVVTGIGVVAPNGVSTEDWWVSAVAGRSGIDRIRRFDPSRYATQFAGEVPDFEPTDYIERRIVVQSDRWTWMGLAATQMALDDGGLRPADRDPYSMSVITANSSGGNEFGQAEIQKLWGQGPRFVGAYLSIAWFYAATTGQIAIRHGIKGASGVLATEGAGGLDAPAHARRTLRRGVDAVVTGGVEAPISPYALACQIANRRMSSVQDRTAYRPFDREATGYLPGEGGAILLVETLDTARERGASTIYGEIAGYGATHDAYHPWEPEPDATQLARAIRLALRDAMIDPEDVDVVFADGAGTSELDALEARALRAALGKHADTTPVTIPKTGTGRLYAGGAALDVAAALLTMRDGRIPPTINVDDQAAGCALPIVRGAAHADEINTALVLARGYGGFNSALVVRRPPEIRANTTQKED
jgi:3-oxoacyl-(acyl-carrier-protein) synthase